MLRMGHSVFYLHNNIFLLNIFCIIKKLNNINQSVPISTSFPFKSVSMSHFISTVPVLINPGSDMLYCH